MIDPLGALYNPSCFAVGKNQFCNQANSLLIFHLRRSEEKTLVMAGAIGNGC
jgi:hypothetical protein